MNERDRLVRVYTEINIAYSLIADIREKHHHDGEVEVGTAELDTLAHTLYRWRERLEQKVYTKSN